MMRRLGGPELAHRLDEFTHGADRLVQLLPGFLQEQRIADAERDSDPAGRQLVEGRERHCGRRWVPQVGTDRRRHEHRPGRRERERHAGRDRLAIAEMLRHPQALRAGIDGAPGERDRLARR